MSHDHGINCSDRLINLSDEIIHHIFSFLGYNDLARVRAVSKRFNLLAILSPYMFYKPNFDQKNLDMYNMKCTNFEDFLRMLVLRRREQAFAPPIESIRLHWFSNNYSDYNFFLYSLIKHASEGKSLQELDITVILERAHLNLMAWRSLISECRSSLKVLRLDCLYSNDNSFLTWLASDHAMSLQTLTLRSLSMSDLTGYKLDITSSSLQVLEIFDAYTSLQCTLNIACRSLERLTMEDVSFSSNSHLNIICPSIKEITMNGCHFFNNASISIVARALVRLIYESKRDCHSLFSKESFKLYAPNLRDVIIVAPKKLSLSTSVITQGPIKQLQVFLTLFLKNSNHDPAGLILRSTPNLQKLSIKISEWNCQIVDSELFHLFRSSPSIVNNGNKFMSILQQKSGKGIKFFNIPKK